MERKPHRVLLVEDNPADARLLPLLVEEEAPHEFTFSHCDRLDDALDLIGRSGIEVVLLDLQLPDSYGFETFHRASQVAPGLPVIVLTGSDDQELALRAVAEGAQDYLVKGEYGPGLLVRSMRYAIERKRAQESLRRANETLEARVHERTRELERANLELTREVSERLHAERALRSAVVELEAFAYSVSHDLRTPLNAIHGLVEELLDDLGDLIPAEAKEVLGRIDQGVHEMHALIDDLLQLSRASRQPLERTSVDLREVVGRVLEELRPAFEGREIDITIDEMPSCTGDAGLVKQVLSNLLSNALKYSRTRKRAVIRVGSFQAPEGTIYFVNDNGVGFPPEKAARVFGVFQRLHSGGEFEGTGVGLAIVQRIVARHGGRIWAESQGEEKGATFYFTLGDACEPAVQHR